MFPLSIYAVYQLNSGHPRIGSLKDSRRNVHAHVTGGDRDVCSTNKRTHPLRWTQEVTLVRRVPDVVKCFFFSPPHYVS